MNWTTTKQESETIRKIVRRAIEEHPGLNFMDLSMDVTACHCNGCPLDLEALLGAKDVEFAHDVLGIRAHIDRKVGLLTNCFLPRYAKCLTKAEGGS